MYREIQMRIKFFSFSYPTKVFIRIPLLKGLILQKLIIYFISEMSIPIHFKSFKENTAISQHPIAKA